MANSVRTAFIYWASRSHDVMRWRYRFNTDCHYSAIEIIRHVESNLDAFDIDLQRHGYVCTPGCRPVTNYGS